MKDKEVRKEVRGTVPGKDIPMPDAHKAKHGTTRSAEIKMSMTRMRARKLKRKRTIILAVSISAFTLLVLITVMVLFFKVNTVDVKCGTMYSAEDIVTASGIEIGDSILSVNRSEAEKNIKKEFTAVKKANIRKSFPSKIVIEITEYEEVLFTAVGENYYSLDTELNVVEQYDSIETIELLGMKRIYIPGVTRCITGEKLETEDDDIPEMIIELCENLMKYDLFYDISDIDFRDKFNITFTLGVEYTVKLGNILECSTKLEFLKGIIEKLGEDYIGTIDLSSGNIKEAVFSRG